MSGTKYALARGTSNSEVAAESPWNDLPRELLEHVVQYLNYCSLLNSRRVSHDWNSAIMDGHFPSKTIFHILPDPSSKFWKKQLGKSALIPNLSGKWSSVHIHHLKQSISLFKSRSNHLDFTHVKNLTLYEGDFTLQQLVSKMLSKMTSLRHFVITDGYFTGRAPHFPHDTTTPFRKRYTRTKDWKLGIDIIRKLETFRIGTHSWISTVMYIKLMTVPKSGNLNTICLDFSKIYGLPFNGPKIEETYNYVADLVALNAGSLTSFHLKWAHRVETDTEISRYDEEANYFLYFLDMLGSTKWPTSELLQLKILELAFPHLNFQTPLIDLVLIPFLQKQINLAHIFLARVNLSNSFYQFNLKLATMRKTLRREYGVYVRDIDPSVATLPYNNTIVSIELHIFWSIAFHAMWPRHPLAGRGGIYPHWGTAWAPQVISLRMCNSKQNSFFTSFNAREIVKTFPYLRQLELLDERNPDETALSSSHRGLGNSKSQIGDEDFLLIVKYLPHLVSIKLSSLTNLTDSGLTGIKPPIISRMQKLGNYYTTSGEIPDVPPLSKMKHLKYLELRNLTESVSDVSVFFGFQHIPKLDKIAFHGEHGITSWGTKVLETKFRNNPRFAIYLKKFAYIPFYNDFP